MTTISQINTPPIPFPEMTNPDPRLNISFEIAHLIQHFLKNRNEKFSNYPKYFLTGPDASFLQAKQGIILLTNPDSPFPLCIVGPYGGWPIAGDVPLDKDSLRQIIYSIEDTLGLVPIGTKSPAPKLQLFSITKWKDLTIEKFIRKDPDERTSPEKVALIWKQFTSTQRGGPNNVFLLSQLNHNPVKTSKAKKKQPPTLLILPTILEGACEREPS